MQLMSALSFLLGYLMCNPPTNCNNIGHLGFNYGVYTWVYLCLLGFIYFIFIFILPFLVVLWLSKNRLVVWACSTHPWATAREALVWTVLIEMTRKVILILPWVAIGFSYHVSCLVYKQDIWTGTLWVSGSMVIGSILTCS